MPLRVRLHDYVPVSAGDAAVFPIPQGRMIFSAQESSYPISYFSGFGCDYAAQ
jgi:hypothetical protein